MITLIIILVNDELLSTSVNANNLEFSLVVIDVSLKHISVAKRKGKGKMQSKLLIKNCQTIRLQHALCTYKS